MILQKLRKSKLNSGLLAGRELVKMTSRTTNEIRKFNTKYKDALLALLEYYNRNGLREISEKEALAFLAKLRSGEVKV